MLLGASFVWWCVEDRNILPAKDLNHLTSLDDPAVVGSVLTTVRQGEGGNSGAARPDMAN